MRKYINKRSKKSLIVNAKDIVEFVELQDTLKIPISYSSIGDKGIEFIKYGLYDKRDLKGSIFIDEEDLTKDLISLYKDYYGCLAVFLYDSECYEADEKYSMRASLDEQFEGCLKKAFSLDCFLTKNTYQGITLYDPKVPQEKERWNWVETYQVQKIGG